MLCGVQVANDDGQESLGDDMRPITPSIAIGQHNSSISESQYPVLPKATNARIKYVHFVLFSHVSLCRLSLSLFATSEFNRAAHVLSDDNLFGVNSKSLVPSDAYATFLYFYALYLVYYL
jgi:hypothetical protein